MIVWAHFGAKVGIGGIQFIAGVGVCLFLICSGYGLILKVCGIISYEIYLVHAFTLEFVKADTIRTVLFMFTTLIMAYLLNLVIGLRDSFLKS